MGNCCTSDSSSGATTTVVVCDPTSSQVQKVNISSSDNRLNGRQTITIQGNWGKCYLYCQNPQAAADARRYDASETERTGTAGDEYVYEFDTAGLWDSGSERIFYIGKIPNQREQV